MEAIALQAIDAAHSGSDTVAITARCLARVTVGTTLSDTVRATALCITTIERYPGVYVDVLEPPHAARIILRGEHADTINPGADLVIHDRQNAESSIHKS